jgi:hypothetical protein
VVQRAEQQDRVPARVRFGQCAGVADDRVEAGRLCRRDMPGHRVHQPDVMAALGEPARVDAVRAADIEHRRAGRQVARQQNLGA